MNQKLKRIITDDFFLQTGIVAIGSILVNIFNFAYHLVMVRLLSGVEYGIFNSLISLTMITSIAFSPIQPTLTKFLSGFFTHREFSKVIFVLKKAIKKLGTISLLIFLFFVIFSVKLSNFLQIDNYHYLIIIGILISISLSHPIVFSFLQAAQSFKRLTLVNVVSSLVKLIIGTTLVYFGFGVMGGLIGFIAVPLGVVIFGILLILGFCKKHSIKIDEVNKVKSAPIYRYFFPTALTMLSFVILTNLDIILVKHFFLPEEAGYYSVAQIVGKILLFLPSAISVVLFPKSASLHAKKSKSIHLLKKGLGLAILCCGVASTICVFAPGFVLKVLTSKTYPQSIELVDWFAVAMSFYAFVWIIMFFHLSRHNTYIVIPFIFFAIIQTATIYFYHPSLKSVLYVLTSFAVIIFLINILSLRRVKDESIIS